MPDDHSLRDAVTLERTFDAPADLIWQMWTEPKHFKVWYGPNGATIPAATLDVRVGGRRLVCMEVPTPGGPMQMWFTGEYREVVANKRLVYTESISDERGKVLASSDGGVPDGYPITTVVTVELQDVGGRTIMQVTHAGIPADSAGVAGWTMALDKLSAFVGAHRR